MGGERTKGDGVTCGIVFIRHGRGHGIAHRHDQRADAGIGTGLIADALSYFQPNCA